jgi:hypothetical protein
MSMVVDGTKAEYTPSSILKTQSLPRSLVVDSLNPKSRDMQNRIKVKDLILILK